MNEVNNPKAPAEPASHGIIERIMADVREIYLSDSRPWVIGYSGGKDSTTALQIIWTAISALPPEQRSKTIYVISSDTLVETPVVSRYIDVTLERIAAAAAEQVSSASASATSFRTRCWRPCRS